MHQTRLACRGGCPRRAPRVRRRRAHARQQRVAMAQQRAVQRALARAAPLQRPHEALQRLHARHLQPAAAGHGVVPRRRARPQRQPRLAARGRRGRAAAAALAAVPGRGLDRVAARARRRARGKLHEQPPRGGLRAGLAAGQQAPVAVEATVLPKRLRAHRARLLAAPARGRPEPPRDADLRCWAQSQQRPHVSMLAGGRVRFPLSGWASFHTCFLPWFFPPGLPSLLLRLEHSLVLPGLLLTFTPCVGCRQGSLMACRVQAPGTTCARPAADASACAPGRPGAHRVVSARCSLRALAASRASSAPGQSARRTSLSASAPRLRLRPRAPPGS